MVHYKAPVSRKAVWYDDKYMRDTYWMLGFYRKTVSELKHFLDERGYHYKKSATKPVLIEAAGRYQRGLLSYGKYTAAELRAFCDARALSIPPESTTVARLSRILEQADDNATFPRFLELPPELRNSVYKFHFHGFDEIVAAHRQPPLTLVPQIRGEALPLFYECVTFSWVVDYEDWEDFEDWEEFERGRCRVSNLYDFWDMPDANLAQVKNFEIEWTQDIDDGRYAMGRRVNITLRVLHCGNVAATAEVMGALETPVLQELTAAVRQSLQVMKSQTNDWGLHRRGIDNIVDAVNNTLFFSTQS